MSKFRENWRLFIVMCCDPWALLLIIAVILLFIQNKSVSHESRLFFIILTTLCSTGLGVRFAAIFGRETGSGTLQTKGKSAVRSLKLLLRGIKSLETRIDSFMRELEAGTKKTALTQRNYEELISACILLEEETLGSIENWKDIVPEADLKTQIGIITDLKLERQKMLIELKMLKLQEKQTKGKSEIEIHELLSKVAEKEQEILKLQSEISKKGSALNLGSPLFSWNKLPSEIAISRVAAMNPSFELDSSTLANRLGIHDAFTSDGSKSEDVLPDNEE